MIILSGQGFSLMWPEGEEKIIAPWHEGSMFTPPDRWFHQHFNVSVTPARYLALAPLPQFSGHSEKVEDRKRDQIEYPERYAALCINPEAQIFAKLVVLDHLF